MYQKARSRDGFGEFRETPDLAKRWLTFLRNHREAIAAMDFFTVPTLTFGVLYYFFVIGQAEQGEIAESGFGEKELRHQDFAGGIVLQAESGESRTAALEPVVRTAIELDHFRPRERNADGADDERERVVFWESRGRLGVRGGGGSRG
jgi:hypothetical protein